MIYIPLGPNDFCRTLLHFKFLLWAQRPQHLYGEYPLSHSRYFLSPLFYMQSIVYPPYNPPHALRPKYYFYNRLNICTVSTLYH